MTVLVFKSAVQTIATEAWVATVFKSSYGPPCIQIHVLSPLAGILGNPLAHIDLSMDEFLSLIAEGGKIVDLRKLQVKR
jgi:hypothetical protein